VPASVLADPVCSVGNCWESHEMLGMCSVALLISACISGGVMGCLWIIFACAWDRSATFRDLGVVVPVLKITRTF
jgi:hypothetical protein